MKHETVHKKQPMNFNPIAQTLTASIRLALPPIAICFTDKVPAGIRNWTGRVPAGCRFWQEAATEVDLYAERIAVLPKANAVLTTFHRVRRKDVEDGKSPTIEESLSAMASGSRDEPRKGMEMRWRM